MKFATRLRITAGVGIAIYILFKRRMRKQSQVNQVRKVTKMSKVRKTKTVNR